MDDWRDKQTDGPGLIHSHFPKFIVVTDVTVAQRKLLHLLGLFEIDILKQASGKLTFKTS